MKTADMRKIRRAMEKTQDEMRYEHTLGVAYTAAALAMRYGASVENAQLAGLLHDCAKYMSGEELIRYCEKHDIEISESERETPHLLHAKAGAYMAGHHYDIKDEDIISAIRWHTTGKPEMTLLEKIVFVADYIEPLRDKAAHLPEIRYMAFKNIDECIFMILKDTLDYLGKNTESIDDTTKIAYDYYRQIHENTIRRNLFD